MANETQPTPEAEASNLPLTGKLVKSIQDNFTVNLKDPEFVIASVGVAKNSLVATDSSSAILIGENASGHEATVRNEVDIEAYRSQKYSVAVRLDEIERNVDPKTGEPRPMPNVQKQIRDRMREMSFLATVDPAALQAIGKVASAANALTVDLFLPEGETKALGFRFTFEPDAKFRNLFNDYEGSIEARGVFLTVQGAGGRSAVDDEDPEEEASAISDPEARSAVAETTVVAKPEPKVTPPPKPEPEPEVPVDVMASVERGAYRLPPLSLLEIRLSQGSDAGGHEAAILGLLRDNNMVGRIDASHSGPRVTQYELSVPQNIKVARVSAMQNDFQMHLGVESVRIEAPIPGKKAIGIEVPNRDPRTVGLRELCASRRFVDAKERLTVALGEDVAGNPVYANLASMPHLLVGGATNSGKSIGVASIIASLLMRNTPKDLRFVMIDPKRVELTLFDRIPHLMCPVIKDVKEAAGVLRAVWREMDRRYDIFSEAGVRNVDGWNAKASENEKLPYIVVVVDELADLMMQCGAEVETVIVRLAQLARATGIHMVIATQRPSVDVVTGLIKANIPSRIGFAVASGTDSKVVLDSTGAEKLLGRGDMLFKPIDAMQPKRVQGAFVSEEEIAELCRFWRDQAAPDYVIEPIEAGEESVKVQVEAGEEPLWEDAVRWAVDRRQVSTSMLQRKFSIGFQRASSLLDLMEEREVVGPRDGPRPRDVRVTPEGVDAFLKGGGVA